MAFFWKCTFWESPPVKITPLEKSQRIKTIDIWQQDESTPLGVYTIMEYSGGVQSLFWCFFPGTNVSININVSTNVTKLLLPGNELGTMEFHKCLLWLHSSLIYTTQTLDFRNTLRCRGLFKNWLPTITIKRWFLALFSNKVAQERQGNNCVRPKNLFNYLTV